MPMMIQFPDAGAILVPTKAQANKPENFGTCSICSERNIRTPSGVVCPNGHGKLWRLICNRQKFLDSFPAATKLKAIGLEHKIEGYEDEIFLPTSLRSAQSWRARCRWKGEVLNENMVVARLSDPENKSLYVFEGVNDDFGSDEESGN